MHVVGGGETDATAGEGRHLVPESAVVRVEEVGGQAVCTRQQDALLVEAVGVVHGGGPVARDEGPGLRRQVGGRHAGVAPRGRGHRHAAVVRRPHALPALPVKPKLLLLLLLPGLHRGHVGHHAGSSGLVGADIGASVCTALVVHSGLVPVAGGGVLGHAGHAGLVPELLGAGELCLQVVGGGRGRQAGSGGQKRRAARPGLQHRLLAAEGEVELQVAVVAVLLAEAERQLDGAAALVQLVRLAALEGRVLEDERAGVYGAAVGLGAGVHGLLPGGGAEVGLHREDAHLVALRPAVLAGGSGAELARAAPRLGPRHLPLLGQPWRELALPPVVSGLAHLLVKHVGGRRAPIAAAVAHAPVHRPALPLLARRPRHAAAPRALLVHHLHELAAVLLRPGALVADHRHSCVVAQVEVVDVGADSLRLGRALFHLLVAGGAAHGVARPPAALALPVASGHLTPASPAPTTPPTSPCGRGLAPLLPLLEAGLAGGLPLLALLPAPAPWSRLADLLHLLAPGRRLTASVLSLVGRLLLPPLPDLLPRLLEALG